MNDGMPRTPAPDQRPIMVVDDDRKIVALVRAYLEREGYRVATAHDGREALRRSRAEEPALIVLDLMLPQLDGLEVMRILRAESDVPVLLLTARGSLPERIVGLERGADDYLPKPFSPAELVVRVKAILRRSRAGAGGAIPRSGTAMLHQHDLTIDTERYEVHRGGDTLSLTPVEFKLLVTLVAADGRALTRDQLLDAVYGSSEGDVLDRTIDVHIGRLREKLGDDADQPRYVMTVRGVGYRAAPTPSVAAPPLAAAPLPEA
jgi:two-component system OmpR family response regulator